VRFVGLVFVMLYHANISWSRGGIFSIDMFFVLSGFLITSLLVTEISETGGIGLKRFWGRRVKRLLPALLFFMFGVTIYMALFATPEEAARARGDGVATMLYVSNWWYTITGSSYFENFQPSLLRHTWSLSIEEQFYLVWPLLFIVGYRWCKGRLELMATLAGVAALASAGLMFVLFQPGTDPSRVYYGTDTRAQALLIGVGLALISHGNARRFVSERWIQLGGWIGYLVFAVIFATTDFGNPPAWLFQGGFLLFALAAALLVFAHAGDDSAVLNRIVGCAPFVWLGSITYGAYLWQWPVFIVVDEARTGLSGPLLLAAQFLITFAIAALSYYLIEVPVRRASFSFRNGDSRRQYAFGVVGAGVAIFVLFVASTTIFGSSAGPANSDSATAKRILVNGDSTAYTLATQYPGTGDLKVATAAVLGCGIVRGANKPVDRPAAVQNTCDTWPQRWQEQEDAFHPDLVVIATGTWELFDKVVDGKVLKVGTPAWFEYARSEYEDAITRAGPNGRPIVLLNAPCVRSTASVEGPASPEENDPQRLAHVNELLTQVAAAHPTQVHLLDLKSFLCPSGQFEEQVDGVNGRPDGVHYNMAGAASVWRWLAPQILQILGGSTSAAAPTTPSTSDTLSPSTTKPGSTTTTKPAPAKKDGDPQFCAWTKLHRYLVLEDPTKAFPDAYQELTAATATVASRVPAEAKADYAAIDAALQRVKPAMEAGELPSVLAFTQWFAKNDPALYDRLFTSLTAMDLYKKAHCA
jgi:peptidoglycan/LPS O-acetylase OafA/YrhL